MSQHVFSLKTNFIVFGALMALLVLTVAAAYFIDAGLAVEAPIALIIATIKATLIMMYFMHLKVSSKLTWLFATASTLWLVILLAFSLSDFLSRDWLRSPRVESASDDSYFSVPATLPMVAETDDEHADEDH